MQAEIEDLSGRPVGPGTLYGAINRLEQEGLIRSVGGARASQAIRVDRFWASTPRRRTHEGPQTRRRRTATTGRYGVDRFDDPEPAAGHTARHGEEIADLLACSRRPVRDRVDVLIAALGLRLDTTIRPVLVVALGRPWRVHRRAVVRDREPSRRCRRSPRPLVVDLRPRWADGSDLDRARAGPRERRAAVWRRPG